MQKNPKTELARSILEVNSEDLEGRKLRKLAAEPVTGYPDMTLLVGEATEMKEKLWRSCGGKVGRLCLGDFCGELAE